MSLAGVKGAAMALPFKPFAGHQQNECPKKAIDVYRLPEQLQTRVDEMYAKVRE